jgi:hypothetical protein
MDMHSKNQLSITVAGRYFQAKKTNKSVILEEYCLNTGYEHKYAIKKLKAAYFYPDRLREQVRKRKKPSKYMIIKSTLKELWEVSDNASAVRLYALMPELIAKGLWYREIAPNQEQQRLLKEISSSTVGRILQAEERIKQRRLNGQTKSGKLKYEIPFAIDYGKVKTVGILEIDLVVHCGNSAMGEFINTLNSTDIITCWYEAEAIMGKSQKAVNAAMEEIDKRLPFKLAGIDSDNGTEFINANLKRFADTRQITFTRSRPYQKNDNAHIEQKNYTHVRKIIGYLRLDTKEQQELLNDLYRNELRLYINFFQPCQKLVKKERVGSKIKRQYDNPQTPYQRVLARPEVPQEVKQRLKQTYDTLNPFELKRQIDKKIRRIFNTVISFA